MILIQKHHYGKDFFYPGDKESLIFLNAFPTSSGQRKCLTKIQLDILKQLGVNLIIEALIYDPAKDLTNTKPKTRKNYGKKIRRNRGNDGL
jgi:hypothetical protein